MSQPTKNLPYEYSSGQPLSAQQLTQLLSAYALHRDGDGAVVNLTHLRDCLSVLAPNSAEVSRLIQRATASLPDPETTALPAAQQVIHQPAVPNALMPPLHDDLLGFLRAMFRRYEDGFLAWKPEAGPRDPLRAWCLSLTQALDREVAGQSTANQQAARRLAVQLANPQRQLPARVFLSGPEGAGTRQMARAIGEQLQAEGYALCEIELSRISSDEYVIILSGGQAQWSGSRPGEVTAHGQKHPKSVFLMHDLHLAAPRAQQALCQTLQSGVMTDEFGLDTSKRGDRSGGRGSDPTKVDLRQAVFVFTTSGGQQELWRNPDMVEMLQSGPDAANDMREAVVAAQRSALRQVRGNEVPVFEPDLLPVLEQDMVLLVPQDWTGLTRHAARCVEQAIAAAQGRLGITLECDGATLQELGAMVVASHGGHANLDRITPASVDRLLFAPLTNALIDQPRAARQGRPVVVQIETPQAVTEQARELFRDMGSDPIRFMQRRRVAMRFETRVLPPAEEGCWTLGISQPRLAQTKDWADYRGDTALTAVVPNARFSDVAGQQVAKAYLREVIDLYRQADALRARGVDLPRGCVLHGPPGTGKTMLAQAFAAEADMAFIAVNGCDLLQPDRVKEVFALARRNAPCVLFVDEIDALGKRGRNSGAHDAAINRLLSLVQGFDQRAPVYVLAATNRPQLLDEALTRPGRLDKSIHVGSLDRHGREPQVRQLLALLNQPAATGDVALQRLLNLSHGMTGADLALTIRESNLLKMRRGDAGITLDDLLEQVNRRRHGDRIGAERHSGLHERTATHEAGHGFLQEFWFPEHPIEQITATARADAEGFMAINAESVTRFSETAERILQHIAVLMGGRAAELLRYGKELGPTSGCGSDFAKARLAAFKAVSHQGLDEVWGPMSLLALDDEDLALMPEQIKAELWGRIRHWLTEAHALALRTLEAHWPVVEQLTAELLANDHVPGERVKELLAAHRAAARSDPQPDLYDHLKPIGLAKAA